MWNNIKQNEILVTKVPKMRGKSVNETEERPEEIKTEKFQS